MLTIIWCNFALLLINISVLTIKKTIKMKNRDNLHKKETSHSEEIIIDKGLLSKKEVAQMFRVTVYTIDRWVRKKYLTIIKMGTEKQSKVYFDKSEVAELVTFKKQAV